MNFADLRPAWTLHPYPPYHEGLYMEEYFYKFYKENKEIFDNIGYTLIPVFWTMAYWQNLPIQNYINHLPKNLNYFCVSQHDDAVREKLPLNTKVFAAGGNNGGVPLPLVCSPINSKHLDYIPKDIFCSFVGSLTHSVRTNIVNEWKNDSDFLFKTSDWSLRVEEEKISSFFNITKRSKFALCPRGYGAQSFRFYEALQLGSVPVYVHDHVKWTPYSDEIDWNKFAVVLDHKDIPNIKDILCSITDEQYENMIKYGKEVYTNHFSLNNLPYKILNLLKQHKN